MFYNRLWPRYSEAGAKYSHTVTSLQSTLAIESIYFRSKLLSGILIVGWDTDLEQLPQAFSLIVISFILQNGKTRMTYLNQKVYED